MSVSINPQAITDGLMVNAVWAVFVIIIGFVIVFYKYVMKKWRWMQVNLLLRLVLSQLTICIGGFIALHYMDVRYVLVFIAVFLCVVPIFMLNRYARIGISGTYIKTSEGIDFKQSLKFANNSFAFLGIGAHKLVSLDEFEPAMRRCALNGNVAKFLLSHPDNPALEKMAKQNKVLPEEYKERVSETIKKLVKMRDNDGMNIEVRLYKNEEVADYQRFRLVFIDEAFCLLSWTVWGSHEGKENPQIILKNKSKTKYANQTMYKAFKDYFNQHWDGSEPV